METFDIAKQSGITGPALVVVLVVPWNHYIFEGMNRVQKIHNCLVVKIEI